MISKLIRFTLCFTLFYSAQSAAYNEAMCILIKQEMQQNNNNKASQKYRKAARDYKKNCNKPKENQAQPKPQIIEPKPAIITQPQPKIVEPAPVIKPTEEAVKESINEQTLNLTNAQKQQINDQLNTNSNEIVIDAEPTKAAPEQVVTEQKNEAVIEQVKPATPEQSVQPTLEKPVPVKPAPVLTKPAPVIAPQPVAQSPSSLLLPTLILVIVILIGAMIVVRLRRAKQSKAMAEPTIAAPPEVKSEKIATPVKPETKTTKEPKIEPVVINEVTQNNKPVESSVEVNEEPLELTNTAQNADVEHTPPQISDEQNNVTTQVQTSEIEPAQIEPADALEQTSTATFNEVKQKPEPNTAEFEAAAKTTLERIKNASSFNEPEVRDFDPDAKPVKKQRKHHTAQVTEPAPTEAEHNTVEPVISTPEPVTASEPVVDLHAPEQIADAQSTTYTTEQDFKEPEVRTFNPDAPLPGEKPMPKKQSATPEQAQTTPPVDEPQSEPKKADSNNPFANLSLDSSWDPDSTEKPKIEEKKRAPKSQALIDAEERAKNMQTK
ncbi:cell surface protein [Pseudoalteromonas sp. SR43-6]|uniref:cell surface protein n=1 Tax=unclassified Pseudoalteromonas TaxID=194690 RepID=UPI0015F8E853|nr:MULTISPECIES: cell surface protein [unclassified Pseudoalteromonas]MBB1288885.1 cell surface protein [Pseudoalteromonas sp. SR41-5]MBB1374702.1 cell surface protein [Pseudoalteromonas sp. SR43-6]MBB1413816.1 cell surface protein [Pseudoalteromonas sp. SG43-8]